jgi:molybdopterin-guanine dinucleotide biosynthesis protein A
VYALLATALADDLEHYLAAGQRKIDQWYATLPHSVVKFDPAGGFFTNFNTPEQLQTVID